MQFFKSYVYFETAAKTLFYDYIGDPKACATFVAKAILQAISFIFPFIMQREDRDKWRRSFIDELCSILKG